MLPATHLLSFFIVTLFLFLFFFLIGCFKTILKCISEEGKNSSHLKKAELKYYFSHSSHGTHV